MTTVTPNGGAPASPPDRGYGIYGELLCTLMPTASVVALARDASAPLWTAAGPQVDALLRAARAVLESGPGEPYDITAERVSVTDDGRAINAFRLHDGTGETAAVVASCYPSFFGERSASDLLGLLRPALECLARELLGARGAPALSALPEAPLLLGVAEQERGVAGNRSELARFVDAARGKLGSSTATLIVPEKNIAVVRRRPGAPVRGSSEFVTRSHRFLLGWAVQQGRPLLINEPDATGRLPPCRMLSVRIRNAAGRSIGFLAFLNDLSDAPFGGEHVKVAELIAARLEGSLQSNYDNLTGLATRAAFERDAQHVLERAGTQVPCAVAYFDIDGMGLINERFSLPVGDAVIAEVGAVLQHRAPRGALASRFAGDRYALLLPGTGRDEAQAVAEALAAQVSESTATSGDSTLKVSVSVGVATVRPESSQPLAHALAAAEQASKVAKRRGRVEVQAADAPDGGDVSAEDIRGWLVADRFDLHAQPILALGDAAREPRFEVLLRGLSPQGYALTPGKLIAVAEAHGLMRAIDTWVAERVFATLAPQRDLMQRCSARFSINLSAQSLEDHTVPTAIEAAWRRSGVRADLVCFEVSEAAVRGNPERAVLVMGWLRRLGFEIALDDAGAGLLSATQIADLPLDVVKVDGEMVRRAALEPSVAEALNVIVTDARSRLRRTVANCIESDEQRARLALIGVDYGQGFAIGRPLRLADALVEVAAHAALGGQSLLSVDGAAGQDGEPVALWPALSASPPPGSPKSARRVGFLRWR